MFSWVKAVVPNFLQRATQAPTPPPSPNDDPHLPSVEAEQDSPLAYSGRKRRRPSPYPTPDAEPDLEEEQELPYSRERRVKFAEIPPPSFQESSASKRSFEPAESSDAAESSSEPEENSDTAEYSPEPDESLDEVSLAGASPARGTAPPSGEPIRQCPVALGIPNAQCICTFKFTDFPKPPSDPPPSDRGAAVEKLKNDCGTSVWSHNLFDLDESEMVGLEHPSSSSDQDELDKDLAERANKRLRSLDDPDTLQKPPGHSKETPIEILDEQEEDPLIEMRDDDSLCQISGLVPETQLDTSNNSNHMIANDRSGKAASSERLNMKSASGPQRYLANANMVPLIACVYRSLPTEQDKSQYAKHWVMRPDLRRALYMDEESYTSNSEIIQAFALSKEERCRKYPFVFQREDGRPYAQYKHLAPESQTASQSSERRFVGPKRTYVSSLSEPSTQTSARMYDTTNTIRTIVQPIALPLAIQNMMTCLQGEIVSIFPQIHAPAVESRIKELSAREKTLRELLELHCQLRTHHAEIHQHKPQKGALRPTYSSNQSSSSSPRESTMLPAHTSRIGPSFASIEQQCDAEDAMYSSSLTDKDLNDVFDSLERPRNHEVSHVDPGPSQPNRKRRAAPQGRISERSSVIVAPAPEPEIPNLVRRIDPEVYATMSARAKGKVNANAVPDCYEETQSHLGWNKAQSSNLLGSTRGKMPSQETRQKPATQTRRPRLQQSQLNFVGQLKKSEALSKANYRDERINEESQLSSPLQRSTLPSKEDRLSFISHKMRAAKHPIDIDTESISDEEEYMLPASGAHTVFRRSPLHRISYAGKSITTQLDRHHEAEPAGGSTTELSVHVDGSPPLEDPKTCTLYREKNADNDEHSALNWETVREGRPVQVEAPSALTDARAVQKTRRSKGNRVTFQDDDLNLETRAKIISQQRNSKTRANSEVILIEDDEQLPAIVVGSKHSGEDHSDMGNVWREAPSCSKEKKELKRTKLQERRENAKNPHESVKKRKYSEAANRANGDILSNLDEDYASERKKKPKRTWVDHSEKSDIYSEAIQDNVSTQRKRHEGSRADQEDNVDIPTKAIESNVSKVKKNRKRTEPDHENRPSGCKEIDEALQKEVSKKRKRHNEDGSAGSMRDKKKKRESVEAHRETNAVFYKRIDPHRPKSPPERPAQRSEETRKGRRTEADRKHHARRKLRTKERAKAQKAKQRRESLYPSLSPEI